MEQMYPLGYSMPFHIEEYPPPPYRLGRVAGANYLCQTTSGIAKTLVPSPLTPNGENHLWLYLVHMTIVEPIAIGYHEIGIFVPVTYEGQPGFFCLALFLDQSLPVTIGREIWGFPKKIADSIVVNRSGDACFGELRHAGATLLDASFRVTQNETRLPGGDTHLVYTHRVIPSWDRANPSINQVVELKWIPLSETRWAAEEAVLNVAIPQSSPLRVLNNVKCIESWLSESDQIMRRGAVHVFPGARWWVTPSRSDFSDE